MDAATLDRIMEFRLSSEIPAEGVAKELLGAAYPMMASYVSFGPGGAPGVFSVEATGYKDTPKKGHSILATVAFDGPQQYRYVYYKSPVEIIQ
jgi:hypothetical protein